LFNAKWTLRTFQLYYGKNKLQQVYATTTKFIWSGEVEAIVDDLPMCFILIEKSAYLWLKFIRLWYIIQS
jgi:hypothetical protein